MFVCLQSTTMNPCFLAEDAYAEAKRSWLCSGCCSPKPGFGAVDARLQEAPKDKPLNFVMGCGLPVAYGKFLDRLGESLVERDLSLGQVFGPDGTRLEDWVTFRGRRRLIIRGSREVSYRRCTECGRDVYFAMGKRYLYPNPPQDVALFESDLFGLVLPEEIFLRVAIEERRGASQNRKAENTSSASRRAWRTLCVTVRA